MRGAGVGAQPDDAFDAWHVEQALYDVLFNLRRLLMDKAMLFLKDLKDGRTVTDPTYTGLDVCSPETAKTCIGG